MLESFRELYPRDAQIIEITRTPFRCPQLPELEGFMRSFGGASFGGSLYRIPRPEELRRWNERIALAFPEWSRTICCFAYDWLGRAFALDTQLEAEGRASVRMFDPGAGDHYWVDANLETLHERNFAENGDEMLEADYFRQWLATGGGTPAADACIGYRIPLFLNGEDDVQNLEMNDLDVYWEVMGQLITQTRDMPPGTRIRSIRIEEA